MSVLDERNVALRREAGDVVASVPGLGLEARAKTADEALSLLDKLYKTKPAEATTSRGANATAAPRSDIRRFAIKCGIVTAMIVFGGFLLTFQLAAVLDGAVHSFQRSFTHVGGSQFWSRLDKELANAADPKNDMPAERKQKLLANIHILVDRWQPFIAEAERAFSTPAPSPTP